MKPTVRRFALVMGFGTTGAAAVLVACGFPSPLLSDIENAPDGDAATTADVAVIADANLDDVPFIDADKPDGIVEDAGGKVDGGGCAPNDCDCDKDGYNDLAKEGCEDAGGQSDCDDLDSRAHPGQGFLEDPAEPPMNGDWNCNGHLEKVYPRTGITCSLLLSDCSEGFAGDPACGEEADYLYCAAPIGILLCTTAAKGRNTQACK